MPEPNPLDPGARPSEGELAARLAEAAKIDRGLTTMEKLRFALWLFDQREAHLAEQLIEEAAIELAAIEAELEEANTRLDQAMHVPDPNVFEAGRVRPTADALADIPKKRGPISDSPQA